MQYLIQGMSEVDKSAKGQYIPRFLGYADDRDFFYLTSKGGPMRRRLVFVIWYHCA